MSSNKITKPCSIRLYLVFAVGLLIVKEMLGVGSDANPKV